LKNAHLQLKIRIKSLNSLETKQVFHPLLQLINLNNNRTFCKNMPGESRKRGNKYVKSSLNSEEDEARKAMEAWKQLHKQDEARRRRKARNKIAEEDLNATAVIEKTKQYVVGSVLNQVLYHTLTYRVLSQCKGYSII
jgi:ABC-type proline/glycine betaine transport system ATPase subunit